MNDKKLSKVLWWLGSLIALLTIILSNALQWITPVDYDKLLSIVPYNWQLTIWMTLLILLLIALLYPKAFPRSTNENSEQLSAFHIENKSRIIHPSEVDYQLRALTRKEKECLKKFLDSDSRTLKISIDDETAHGLHSMGILWVVSPMPSFRQFSYRVVSPYWDHIKRNSDLIEIQEKK